MKCTIRIALSLVAIGLLTAAGCPAVTNFTATFSGAQEVPQTVTTGSGTGTFTLNAARTELTYNVSAQNLISPVISAHFHTGAPGVDGPIVEDISANIQGDQLSLTITGTWSDLTADELSELLAGNVYVNIHSELFPGGEIRGQLTQSN